MSNKLLDRSSTTFFFSSFPCLLFCPIHTQL